MRIGDLQIGKMARLAANIIDKYPEHDWSFNFSTTYRPAVEFTCIVNKVQGEFIDVVPVIFLDEADTQVEAKFDQALSNMYKVLANGIDEREGAYSYDR